MLVLIPTFKRLETLSLVIDSVLLSELPKLHSQERLKLIVVNNHPPSANEVCEIISKFKKEQSRINQRWAIESIHRPVTLAPVENWFSAVQELALKDEVVFFVGDDDPIPARSIRLRYEALFDNNATMVFGRLNPEVYFSSNAKYVYQADRKRNFSGEVFIVGLEDLWDWTAIHLSNHCFINNNFFSVGLKEAFQWCDSQGIGTLANRRLFITYYIPIAIILNQGKIIGLDEIVLHRGMSIEEVRSSKYGIRSWNLGYIAGLALNMLNSGVLKEIKQLDNVRDHLMLVLRKWYIAIKRDDRITEEELNELLAVSVFDVSSISFKEKLFSYFLILKYRLRLQALVLYIKNLFYRVPSNSVKW